MVSFITLLIIIFFNWETPLRTKVLDYTGKLFSRSSSSPITNKNIVVEPQNIIEDGEDQEVEPEAKVVQPLEVEDTSMSAEAIIKSITAGAGMKVSGIEDLVVSNTGVLSLGGKTGDIYLEEGGLKFDGQKLYNADKGSAQNIFKTIKVEGEVDIKADTNNTELHLAAGTGIEIDTNNDEKRITINGKSGWIDHGSVVSLVDEADNLRLKGLTYTFPSSHGGSGTFLQNDGNGALTWANFGASMIPADSIDFTELKDNLTLDANTDIALAGKNFSFSGTGNVGIGTTDPTARLHVLDTLKIDSDSTASLDFGQSGNSKMRFYYDATGYNSSGPGLVLLNYVGGGYGQYVFKRDGRLGIGDINPISHVSINNRNGVRDFLRISSASNNNGDLFLIDSLGRIGVGTTSPQTRLQIVDNNTVSNFKTQIGIGSLADNRGFNLGIDPFSNGTNSFYIYNNATGHLPFAVNGQTVIIGNYDYTTSITSNLYLRATNGGLNVYSSGGLPNLVANGTNVGIGLSAPVAKLDVAGTSWLRGSTGPSGGLYVDGNGNTGIGTTNPNSLLDVNGATILRGNLTFGTDNTYNIGANGADRPMNIYLGKTLFATGISNGAGANIQANDILLNANSNLIFGGTYSYTSGHIIGSTNSVTLKADNLGNGLTVNTVANGNTVIKGSTVASSPGAENILSLTRTLSGGIANSQAASFAVGTYQNLPIGTLPKSRLDIRLKSASDGNDYAANSDTVMTFLDNGNIGIGTTSPGGKLEVNQAVSDVNDTKYGLKILTDAYNSTGKNLRLADLGESYYLDIGGYKGAVNRFNSNLSHRFALNNTDVVYMGTTTVDGGVTYASLISASPSSTVVPIIGKGASGQTADLLTLMNSSNSKLFVVNSSGNVGIGTTGPFAKMSLIDVNTFDTANSGTIGFSYDTSGNYRSAIANRFAAGSATNNKMLFRVSDGTTAGMTDVLTLVGSGNVGIGTTSPSAMLAISSSASNTTGMIRLTMPASGTPTSNGRWIQFDDYGAAPMYSAGFYRTSADVTGRTYRISQGANLANNVSFQIDQNGTVGIGGTAANSAAKLTIIGPSGNIGIGTISPSSLLDVAGTSWLRGSTAASGGLYVNGSGNVGIGTTSPAYALDVNGTVNAGGIRLNWFGGTNNDWGLRSSAAISIGSPSANVGDKDQIVFGYPGTYGSAAFGPIITDSTAYKKTDFVWALRNGTTDTAPTEAMRLTAAGSLGIGTTSPGSALDVNGVITVVDSNLQLSNIGGYPRLSGAGGLTIDIDSNNDQGTRVLQITHDGGTELMRIQENGNVGIGTTSPINKLHVNGSMTLNAAGDKYYFNNNAGTQDTNWSLGYESAPTGGLLLTGNAVVQTVHNSSTRGYMIRNTSNTSLFEIQGSDGKTYFAGNVGIGTTSPVAKLQVVGSADTPQLTIKGNSTQTTNIFEVQTSAGTTLANVTGVASGNINANFGIYNNGTLGAFLQGFGDSYLVAQSGNVGIGTVGPGAKLDVRGGVRAEYSNSTPTNAGNFSLARTSDHAVVSAFRMDTDDDFHFDIWSGSAWINPFTILKGGNVGIGTTSPQAGLHIANTNGFRVTRDDISFLDIYDDSGDGRDWRIKTDSSTLSGAFVIEDINNSFADVFTIQAGTPANTLYLNSSGNVGIGTTSPGYKLDIAGNQRLTGDLLLYSASGATPALTFNTGSVGGSSSISEDVSGNLVLTNAAGGSRATINGFQINSSGLNIGFNAASGVIHANNGAATSITLTNELSSAFTGIIKAGGTQGSTNIFAVQNNSGTDFLNVKSTGDLIVNSGNIGIGTTSPSYKLHIIEAGSNWLKIQDPSNNFGIIADNGQESAYNNRLAIGWTGDANRRLYMSYHGDSDIATIRSGGAAALKELDFSGSKFVFNTGNVGIGTTAPVNKLHIYSNNSSTGNNFEQLRLEQAGSGDVGMDFLISGTTGYRMGIDNSDSDKFKIGTSEDLGLNNILTLTTGGNVGIGTTSPANLLEISNSGSPLIYLRRTASAADGQESGGISIRNTTSYEAGYIKFIQRNSNLIPLTDIVFGTTKTGNTEAVEHMRILNSGNVGIGTTNPSQKLSLVGKAFIQGPGYTNPAAQGTSADGERIIFYDNAGWKSAIGMDAENGVWVQAHAANAGDKAFSVWSGANAATPTEKFRVTRDGNVGIGTSTPTQFLQFADPNCAYNNGIRFANTGAGAYPAGIYYGCPGGSASGWGLDFYSPSGGGTSVTNLSLRGNRTNGFNTIAPDKALEVNSATGNNLRLTYNDSDGSASNYADFGLTSTGNLHITPSGGNVGIGTTGPGAALHVSSSDYPLSIFERTVAGGAGSQYVASRLKLTLGGAANDGAGPQFEFMLRDWDLTDNVLATLGAVRSGADNSGSLVFNTSNLGSNTEKMRLTNAGNVGIGTTNPSQLLEVNGAARFNSNVYFNSGATQGGYIAGGSDIRIVPTSGNFFVMNQTNTGVLVSASGGNVGVGIQSPKTFFDVNSLFNVTSGGNVGIGTTSPSYPLDVSTNTNGVGAMRIKNNSSGTLAQAQVRLENNDSSAVLVPFAISSGYTTDGVLSASRLGLYGYSANGMVILNDHASGDLLFATGGHATSNERMRINSSGNVGIGTTAPSFPLDVASTVSSNQTYGYLNSSGVVGTSSGTSTYSIRASGRILSSEFNAVSDARLKDVQFDLDPAVALNAIMQLKPVSFTWKDNPSGQPILGLLAQDVEGVIPNAVSKIATSKFVDQRELSYNQLTAVLIGAIKKQQQEIDQINIREIPNQVRDDRLPMNDKIASIEAALASLKTDVDVMKTQTVETSRRDVSTIDFDSDTATLSALIVSGKTNVYDLGVTGTLTAGLLSINGMDDSLSTPSATIRSAGLLSIQPDAFANVEFMNGKVTIDTKGNITTEGTLKAKKIETNVLKISKSSDTDRSVGEATILAGTSEITITNATMRKNSKVFITVTSEHGGQTIAVKDKQDGTFTVWIEKNAEHDITFDYWIIEIED